MSNCKKLLQRLKKLKQRLKELKQQQVGINYESIHEIQVKTIENAISKIGRQLINLKMYEGDNDD